MPIPQVEPHLQSNSKKFRTICLSLISLTFLWGCAHETDSINPKIGYQLTAHQLGKLPPVAPLPETLATEVEKEMYLGVSFGRERDFYRAITSFKRARLLLLKKHSQPEMAQIDYSLALAYYLGNKYEESINCFEGSSLEQLTHESPCYKSILAILYDSYLRRKEYRKVDNIEQIAKALSPDFAKQLTTYKSIETTDLLTDSSELDPKVQAFRTSYLNERKSRLAAELYNAVLPGAGYLYVGQTQAGITSFLLNAVFIAATAQFFHKGQTAAGIITAGFELGWYFGGIRGAGLAAKQYNEKLYATKAHDFMAEHKLFPVLMVEVGF